jgi:hypothetical protein
MMKFTHTTGSEVFYSNPFHVTEQVKGTTYINYKSNSYYKNTDYINASFYQGIRLKNYLDKLNDETEIESYLQDNGAKVTKRTNPVFSYDYKIDNISFNTVEAFAIALKNGIVYLNGYRATSAIKLDVGERYGNSNRMSSTFKAYLNKNEQLAVGYQIFAPFELTTFSPTGILTIASLPMYITGTFSSDIVLGTGTLTIYNDLGAAILTLTEADILTLGNGFTATLTGIIANGVYTVVSTLGMFNSVFGDSVIINETFEVTGGDWLSTDWLSTDWLI